MIHSILSNYLCCIGLVCWVLPQSCSVQMAVVVVALWLPSKQCSCSSSEVSSSTHLTVLTTHHLPLPFCNAPISGAPLDESYVLTASVFTRLQRRHSIASPIHYLYIYRVCLPFILPARIALLAGGSAMDPALCLLVQRSTGPWTLLGIARLHLQIRVDDQGTSESASCLLITPFSSPSPLSSSSLSIFTTSDDPIAQLLVIFLPGKSSSSDICFYHG